MCSVRPPQIFQVQAKISTVRPVFPDYLSVSYDYERIQKYLGFQEKEALLSSFVLSNFNYCPLVWHFCSSKSLKKIEKIQERTLRILYNDSTSDYNQLLNKSSKASMEVKRLRKLALEIFKTLNNLNPEYMKEISYKTANLKHRP